MKIWSLMLIIVVTACMIFSCNPNKPADQAGTLEVGYCGKIDSTWSCCTDVYSICIRDYTSSRSDTALYWLALVPYWGTEPVVVGDTALPLDTASTYNYRSIAMPISAAHNVNCNQAYNFYAYRCYRLSDVGDVSKADVCGKTPNTRYLTPTDFGINCATECCTEGPKYCEFQHQVDNVVAVKASILTQYGRLCGWSSNPDSTSDVGAASFVYCGIAKEEDGQTYWAQVGYGIFRPAGRIYVWPSFYCEASTDSEPAQWYAYQDPNLVADSPLVNEWHSYACDLDETIGKWHFFIDGVAVPLDPDYIPNSSIWENPGEICSWAGEISHLESDMPGTSNDPVVLDSLAYMLQGDNYFRNALYDLQTDRWGSDDPYQWGFQWDTISSTGIVTQIRIWDRTPLPSRGYNLMDDIVSGE